MKKFLIALIAFLLGLIVFMPKKDIFYTAEHYLKDINIVSKIQSNPFFLKLNNGKIYYLNIKAATFKEAIIFPFILYNQANIKNLKIDSLNLTLNNIKIIYSPFYFKKAFIFADNLKGEIDILNKKIHLESKNPPNYLKGFMKKTKKGYELNEKF
jgi:hypothetical protein